MLSPFARHRFVHFLTSLAAAVLCLGTVAASAQNTTTVNGIVKDVSGGVLPGAVVDVMVAGRVFATATSDADGGYQVTAPARVPFDLQVRLGGFADETVPFRGIDTAARREVVLQVGRVSDTLVVTASRGAEDRAAVTQAVTVVTADDVHALGSRSLADVVRYVPGVAVEGPGRESGLMSLFSRGGESDYTLVLIDGVRVTQNGGVFDFSRIDASEIERVEVVRGAQSSLWGSDAMGAVVQVITRRSGAADAPRVTGSVEGGSFGSFRGDARVTGGALGRVDYQLGAFHRRSDGAFADILAEDDTFEQSGYDLAGGAALGSRGNVRAALRSNQGHGRSVGPIAYYPGDTGTIYDSDDLSWHVDGSHVLGGRYTGSGTVSYFSYDGRNDDTIGDPSASVYMILAGTPNALFPDGMRLVRRVTRQEFDSLAAAGAMPAPGQVLASASSFDFAPSRSLNELRRPSVRYQGDFTWSGGHRLTAGYDWEHETRPAQTSPAVLPELTTDNNAFFVQQQFTFADRWFVTAGVRSDARDGYDTFVSPKLSAGGFIVPFRRGGLSSLKVFGNIGQGIKTPVFYERFGASYADPNLELKVERARSADAGVDLTLADQRVRAAATWFDNKYKDQIAFRSGRVGDGIPEFINIDGSQARGLELEVALQRPVAGLTAGLTYSLVDTEVVTALSTSQQFQPGQPLLRRPKHSGSVRAAYVMHPVTVSFDARWVGDRHDNSFLFLQTVANAARPSFFTDITVNPGYAVAGFGVDVAVAREAAVFLRANNAGDTAYEGVLGWPGAPRAVVAGVRFNVGRR